MSFHPVVVALVIGMTPGGVVQDPRLALLPMSRVEQEARGVQFRREWTFERTDADADGVISDQEWAARNWARAGRFDVDQDARLSLVEFATSVCPIPRSGKLRETDLRCIEGRARRLRALDVSGDGLLSEDEHRRASLDYFRQADLCPDGVLQREELNGDIRSGRRSCGRSDR